MIQQIHLKLPEFPRGFHLITPLIMKWTGTLPDKGLMNIFLKHTSAGLAINENFDPSVRTDLENIFNRLVPENQSYYTHTSEGSDDMPSHAKSILTSCSLTIPITGGELMFGSWQGIYLCEFRNEGEQRDIVITIYN